METIKYPSINAYKNLIRTVKDRTCYRGKDEEGNPIYVDAVLPKIKFQGTVKAHGTNGGVRFTKDGELVAQSRERDLSLTQDNAGFYLFVQSNKEILSKLASSLIGDADAVVIFGEWCGGNIQGGVALNQIEKMFAIFGIKTLTGETEKWVANSDLIPALNSIVDIETLNKNKIFAIPQFGVFEMEIDFENPSDYQNKLVEITDQIENECPIGKYFGVSGVGEGAVWCHNSEEYGFLTMKVKGEKHSNSKVRKLAPVDEEAFSQAKEFAENYTTQARLEQGISVLRSELMLEPDQKNLGEFIRWVVSDVFKEEETGIIENNLDPKKVSKEIVNIARKFYLSRL